MVSEKNVHTLGSRFSRDVHGIFANPKETVRKIIAESHLAHAFSVPFLVVIISAVMTVFGKYIWADVLHTIAGGPLWYEIASSIIRGFLLFAELIVTPVIFVILWGFWALVFHFIGAVVSSADVTDKKLFDRTLKLTGFMFAPMFLNMLPFFSAITGYWSVLIAFWGMKANYETSDSGAFIIVLPYLFTVVYGTLLLLFGIKI